MRDGLLNIEQRHLSLAIDKVMMGEKTDRESSVEEKKRVAIHELGHAIMAELVRPGSVSQVALSPRGQALGYVRHNPQQEQFLYTKRFLEEQIMIALGGANLRRKCTTVVVPQVHAMTLIRPPMLYRR